jgi:hypothetical protein
MMGFSTSIEVKKRPQRARKVNQATREMSMRVDRKFVQSLREEFEREEQAQIFWVRERSQWLHRTKRTMRSDDTLWGEVG